MAGAVLNEDEADPKLAAKPVEQSTPRSVAIATSLVSGAFAGAVAKTVIAPLDRTKIYFQISEMPYSWRGALNFIKDTVKTSGVKALWRGNSATMARIIPYASVQFASHEQWKRVLGVDNPKAAREHPVLHLIAGSLAGVTSQSATYPLDLARARMSVYSASEYKTLVAVFKKVTADEGYRALYRGYPVTVIGIVPYAGVSFYTYDTLKRIYYDKYGSKPSGWINLVFGGCAGVLGQTASYPLDVIRRRMQTTRVSKPTAIGTIKHVWKHEGWRGYFKSLSMNWVKGPIAVGISFATFDATRTNLRKLVNSIESNNASR